LAIFLPRLSRRGSKKQNAGKLFIIIKITRGKENIMIREGRQNRKTFQKNKRGRRKKIRHKPCIDEVKKTIE